MHEETINSHKNNSLCLWALIDSSLCLTHTHFNFLLGWTIAFFCARLMVCLGLGQTSPLQHWDERLKLHQQPGGEPMAGFRVHHHVQTRQCCDFIHCELRLDTWPGFNTEITAISTQSINTSAHVAYMVSAAVTLSNSSTEPQYTQIDTFMICM